MSEITEFKKWAQIELSTTPEYPDGVIHIKEDTRTQCPVGLLPLPLGKHPRGTERQRRNANLIVAASDLLHACRQVLTNGFNDQSYNLLIEAVEKATGSKVEIPDKKLLVCVKCGSIDIEHRVCVNANTSVCTTDTEDADEQWCNDCLKHAKFILLSDFKAQMEEWWRNLDDVTKRKISSTYAEMKSNPSRWVEIDFNTKKRIWKEERLDSNK